MHQISILVPLAVSTGAILCTIMIHTMPVGGTIWFFRRERKLGHMGRDFWSEEIALWAILFLLCGEFEDIGTAYYHSAVNFTTLGYGDVLLSPHWRMLGPLEAATGMLMFGVSTAMVFAVIQRLAQTRFVDLRV